MLDKAAKRLLVTGGAGFIGSAFIRFGLTKIPSCEKILNLDLLTYAGHLENLKEIERDERYQFILGDIANQDLVECLCEEHKIDTIVHFAAESHVDRSILGPTAFYKTNVEGTIHLLEVMRRLPHIHFHHVSTDEVYGSLGEEGSFTETSPYKPNSPYSASKAASDHFVRAYAKTYDLSTTISHCSNNYGPYQNTEKFIPNMILGCIEKRPLPVYGQGGNIRDWLFVDDHVEAIWTILSKGIKGEVYGIGGGCEKRNLDLLHILIQEYAFLSQEDPNELCRLIKHVPDRPGHDFRYAIDASKIERELGWRPKHDFTTGIRRTILWYLENYAWNRQEV